MSLQLNSVSTVAQRNGVELVITTAASTVPTSQPVGGPFRVKQIMLNLLSNSVKYTSQSSVEVSWEVEDQDVTHSLVSIHVKDTGIGSPPQKISRLFKSFSQIDSSITRSYGGSGLGLAISQQLAELMGGSCTANSAGFGSGSTFTRQGGFWAQTILWNFDSGDWTIRTGAAESSILDAMNGKITGPKSPGLLPLEHQLSDGAVDVFITIYPTLVAHGWNPLNVSLPWYVNSASANSSLASDTNTTSTDTFDGPPRNLLSGGPSNAAFCRPPPPPPCTTRSHPPLPPCTTTGPPPAATPTASIFSLPTAGHAAAAVVRPSAPHVAPIGPGSTASPIRGVTKLTDYGFTPEVLKQIGHPFRSAPAKAAVGVATLNGAVKAVGAGGISRPPHRRDQDIARGKTEHGAWTQGRESHVHGGGTSPERRLDLDQGLMYFSFV